ncbi:lipid IV(A) 3-deoxy-D-manno-octulosonic acid transferase [Aliivibrio sp. SR45-2]|uniref:lipid IV(A) 3-deoxy-D-manno-octulosonic acid transferase n=1 Tax=Aliivibrio sp. SR45-2 TaxID=2760931 RepID=UPI0015FB4DB0|nr:lipid IV(A) 3-deoxy-D-manno-octulosonic acid transferase [Aliivibrio sp. SR45-2]MBB1315793.1 lipid IV(A) 3-deoxy-D-manno-octulosonic acid transferase [Aliivibrio sp. SR45-2]
MIRFFYTLILSIFSPFLLYSLYKKKEGKPPFGGRWKEHFGFTPKLNTIKQPIWIHAVSVGEVIAALPIIKALKKQNPTQAILVTTTTSTGAEQIEKLGELVEHRYMPIDFSFAIRNFLKVTNPKKMLIMETELWPNTLYTVAKHDIPISVLNARLSQKSYLGYKKIQPIFNLLAKNLTHICCQYQDDANRFIALGIQEEKVHITGSVKFDIEITDNIITLGKNLREQLGTERPIWIAASTHKGEDEQVLIAHKKLLESIPDVLLILVPRHPERFNSVFELCCAENMTVTKRTSKKCITDDVQIYLADTMGEMLTLIGASDVCFMGGSLIGNKVGGHNIIEPIALNIPTIIGPSYYNFQEIIDKLLQQSGCIVSNNNELCSNLLTLLTNTKSANKLSYNAYQFLKKQQGSINKSITIISSVNKVS